jgi:lysophospholipase L1-like esterase
MDEDLVLGLYLLLPLVSGGLLALFAQSMRARRGPPGIARLVLGNFLVLLFLLSFGVLGGEIYYRFFCDTTDALGYTKINQRWFDRHWQLNSSEFRDDINYSLEVKPDKRRISFLGDSFTAGHGIKNVEDRFVNRIRRAHPEWEVQLLAQPGFNTDDEIEQVEECVRQHFQLDVVVLVYCLNDVMDMFPEWTDAVLRLKAQVAHSGWLRQNSYLVNTLYYRLFTPRQAGSTRYYDFIAQGYRGAYWERQQQRLKHLRDLVQSHGGRLLVVTFPFFERLGTGYPYQSMHEQLGRCWQTLGVPHLDLLPVYRNVPTDKLTVNRRDAHPNEYANRLAADAVEKFLQRELSNP